MASCCRSIEEIKAELALVIASINRSMQVLEYDFDTGQNRQRVKRESLKELIKQRNYLRTELAIACSKQNNTQVVRGVVC